MTHLDTWRSAGAYGPPPSACDGWTEPRVDELTRLAFEGYTASQIAAEIGGVTRNAVIGKIKRDKIAWNCKRVTPRLFDKNPDDKPPTRKRAPRRKTNTALQFNGPSTMATEEYVEPATSGRVTGSRMVSLMDRKEAWCAWPIGDPRDKDFCYCGADRADPCNSMRPYCPAHERAARAVR